MASPSAMDVKRRHAESLSGHTAGNLDVAWLLHTKKDSSQQPKTINPPKLDSKTPPKRPQTEPSPPQSPTDPRGKADKAPSTRAGSQQKKDVKGKKGEILSTGGAVTLASQQIPNTTPQATSDPPVSGRGPGSEENKTLTPKNQGNVSKPPAGRKSSFFSSLSSKFSSGSPTPPRSASVDVTTGGVPQKSPKVEFGNPFDKKDARSDGKKEKKEEKVVITPSSQPRRPSVLVQAGKETKLEHPGFLSSALRRLSSSNNVTMGKGAGVGAICPRKVMNVNQNRDRVQIPEFDPNRLKRVAFCVDVEIAGYAVQADEQDDPATKAKQLPIGQRQSLASDQQKKKDPSYKDKAEGAALKNPHLAAQEKEDSKPTDQDSGPPTTEEKPAAETPTKKDEKESAEVGEKQAGAKPSSGTKKKEKKKRSEAERKERREKKRRHAEANGLVPLELTRDDSSDSNSSHSNGSAGVSTPNSGDQPTTDPLRIYKRCCQLRETTALQKVKEQISKPVATLAESPGTVAILDLSGMRMPLQDIITLGDWLAVVPVRKLILDDCGLTDEALRVILSGLAGCKSTEQAKHNRKLPRRGSGKSGSEQLGVIERLSLKDNPSITNLGWKHIALFLYLSRSIRAIDLSGIPFPKRVHDPLPGDLSRAVTTSSTGTNTSTESNLKMEDLGTLISKALSERFGGDRLEELILSGTGLVTSNVGEIVDCAIKCKIRRLGLANVNLTQEGMVHVVRYLKSDVCEGLDLGSNDLHGSIRLLAEAFNEDNPLFAMSLSDCNLTPQDLETILTPLTKLKSFKFIDLSRNHALFAPESDAVSVFRKVLPKLQSLKRIHLCDVDMTSEHVIALAEIFPDCTSLAHVSILDNPGLINAMNSTQSAAQEEACAFFVALMTAVRASRSIVAIEIEVPSAESSEVVKALASQVVAYSLRNMEQETLGDVGGAAPVVMPDKDAPEVLLHLVGHMEGYEDNHDNDEPAPDEDYVIASGGIVKALGVCLGTKDHPSRTASRNITPTASGSATPKQGPLRPTTQKRPKDVSTDLCNSARKIRMRLRPALIREDRAGNTANYRRLLMLDNTLERMIRRFEDEYPETKVSPLAGSPPVSNGTGSLGSALADASLLSASTDSNRLSQVPSMDEFVDETPGDSGDPYAIKLSRTSSNTSLAAKAQIDEEGRMLRFGQTLRRDILKPTGTDDFEHGTSVHDPAEAEHLAALRTKLEEFQGDEIRRKVETEGVDNVIREIGINLEELRALQKEDPEGFQAFRESQLAAQINAQRRAPPELKT